MDNVNVENPVFRRYLRDLCERATPKDSAKIPGFQVVDPEALMLLKHDAVTLIRDLLDAVERREEKLRSP